MVHVLPLATFCGCLLPWQGSYRACEGYVDCNNGSPAAPVWSSNSSSVVSGARGLRPAPPTGGSDCSLTYQTSPLVAHVSSGYSGTIVINAGCYLLLTSFLRTSSPSHPASLLSSSTVGNKGPRGGQLPDRVAATRPSHIACAAATLRSTAYA